jgi:antirestriction protein ArdC
MTKRITAESKREDIYTRVTNRIVEQLEQGVRPWTKPWSAGGAAGIARLADLPGVQAPCGLPQGEN